MLGLRLPQRKKVLSLFIMISLAFILFYSHIPNIYVNAQASCHNLYVKKLVLNDIKSITSEVQFHIIVRIDGFDNDFYLFGGQANFACLDSGQVFRIYEVNENLNINFASNLTGHCSGIMGRSDITCTITNRVR
jgi:hypothetical protein